MALLTVGVSVLAFLALVHAQVEFYKTPNIASVEQVIGSGQQLCSLTDLRNAITGLSTSFTLQVEQTSDQASNGLRRQKLRILYNGVRVRTVKLQASIDENDCYTGAVSGYYPINFGNSFDASLTRTTAELRGVIVNYMDANDAYPPFVAGITDSMLENFSEDKQIQIDSATGDATLVYHVRGLVDVPDPTGAYIRYPRALIRVSDLSILNIDLVVLKDGNSNTGCAKATGGNEKFAGNEYGPGSHRICLNAEKNGPFCTYRNDNVEVFTVNNDFERDNAQVVTFQCSKGPEDEINGGFSPSSDTFYFSQVFFNVLQDWAGLSNERDEPIRFYVHFGGNYPNSFFDGRALTLGDGTNFTHPIAVQEIIGHELGHMLTDLFDNLQMNTETVALNEAFSDICGKAVSVFEGELDWMFAKRFVRHEVALRYFDDPTLDGVGIDHLDDFDLSRGVYSVMGVITKFLYTVVEIEHISFRDAFQSMVMANQLYWNEESSIIDGSCGILRAASDLALDVTAFEDAFNSVGINLTFCDLSGTQDVIPFIASEQAVERHIIVSASRNPEFVIKADPGFEYVEVRVARPEHFFFYQNTHSSLRLYTTVNGGVVVDTHSTELTITLEPGTDVIVGVKSDSEEAVTADLYFVFH